MLVAAAPTICPGLSTITYGLLMTELAEPCFMCTGVEVGVRGSGDGLGVDIGEPDTILQLMVIGWKDFPGDSAGLGI